jgi:hypothetical protein
MPVNPWPELGQAVFIRGQCFLFFLAVPNISGILSPDLTCSAPSGSVFFNQKNNTAV